MELEDLKQLLLKPEMENKSSEEIALYLKLKSNSMIDKIRRSMLMETICAVLFAIAGIAWFFLTSEIFYKALAVFIASFSAGFLVYLRRLNKRILSYQTSVDPVRKKLADIIDIVSTFTRLYFRLTMLAIPLVFLMAIFTMNDDPGTQFSSRQWIFFILWFAFWSAFMYYFTKWYIKKLYGNYLEQLKKQYKELEESAI